MKKKLAALLFVDNTNSAEKVLNNEIAKLSKADVESQVYTEFDEQFQALDVTEGKVTEEDINTACRRILEAKYKLGLFSNPYRYCNTKRNKTDIYSAENRQIARDVAAETFVLLKNEGNLLPLKKGSPDNIHPQRDHNSNLPTGSEQNLRTAAPPYCFPERLHPRQCVPVHHPAGRKRTYSASHSRHSA